MIRKYLLTVYINFGQMSDFNRVQRFNNRTITSVILAQNDVVACISLNNDKNNFLVYNKTV